MRNSSPPRKLSYLDLDLEFFKSNLKIFNRPKGWFELILPALLLIIFDNSIKELIVNSGVLSLFNNLDETWHIFLYILVFGLLAWTFVQAGIQRFLLSRFWFIVILTICGCWFIEYRSYHEWSPILINKVQDIAVLDFYFALPIFWLVSYLWKSAKKLSEYDFDLFQEDLEIDSLKEVNSVRSNLAQDLSEKLIKQNFETTFNIGIVGPWGAGKSSFIKEFKKGLENGVIIDFAPAEFDIGKNVTTGFFEILTKKLNSFDSTFNSNFYKYSEIISHYSGGIISKVLSAWNSKDPSVLKSKIDKSIRRIGKKVFVFIDDLDRIDDPDEIRSIFFLIRNNANFPNFHYVLAYDKSCLLRHFEDKAYFDKYIQFEVFLPALREEQLRSEFVNRVLPLKCKNVTIETFLIEKLELAVSQSQYFKEEIRSGRDVIQLSNNFRFYYQRLTDSVVVSTFLDVMILKLKKSEAYTDISLNSEKYFDFDKSIMFKCDNNRLIDNLSTSTFLLQNYPDLTKVLRCIFESFDLPYSVRASDHFHLYFNLEELAGLPTYSLFKSHFNNLQTNSKFLSEFIARYPERTLQFIESEVDEFSKIRSLFLYNDRNVDVIYWNDASVQIGKILINGRSVSQDKIVELINNEMPETPRSLSFYSWVLRNQPGIFNKNYGFTDKVKSILMKNDFSRAENNNEGEFKLIVEMAQLSLKSNMDFTFFQERFSSWLKGPEARFFLREFIDINDDKCFVLNDNIDLIKSLVIKLDDKKYYHSLREFNVFLKLCQLVNIGGKVDAIPFYFTSIYNNIISTKQICVLSYHKEITRSTLLQVLRTRYEGVAGVEIMSRPKTNVLTIIWSDSTRPLFYFVQEITLYLLEILPEHFGKEGEEKNIDIKNSSVDSKMPVIVEKDSKEILFELVQAEPNELK